MGHIFVSYSREDQSVVDRLAQSLKQSGFNAWVDREGIRGGIGASTESGKNAGRQLRPKRPRKRPPRRGVGTPLLSMLRAKNEEGRLPS